MMCVDDALYLFVELHRQRLTQELGIWPALYTQTLGGLDS